MKSRADDVIIDEEKDGMEAEISELYRFLSELSFSEREAWSAAGRHMMKA